jgi:DNA replication protein DnaC
VADPALIGRAAELERLEANVARRRHTLLVGPVGIGKSHLLRALHARLPEALYVDAVRPLRVTLLALCQTLHARQQLVLAVEPALVAHLQDETLCFAPAFPSLARGPQGS